MIMHTFNRMLAIVGLVLLINSAGAQLKLDKVMTDTTPEERANLQSIKMRDKFSLSEEQYQQVQEINLKYARKMQSVYNTDQGKLKRLKGMKSVGEEKDKELKRVLSSSQYEMYQRQKEEVRKKSRERGNGPGQ